MSKQNENFTWQSTRRPERMPLCRTTPLSLGNRAAKCNVGPLPTDCPYRITSSWLTPYSVWRHSYAASISAYVSNSLGWTTFSKKSEIRTLQTNNDNMNFLHNHSKFIMTERKMTYLPRRGSIARIVISAHNRDKKTSHLNCKQLCRTRTRQHAYRN